MPVTPPIKNSSSADPVTLSTAARWLALMVLSASLLVIAMDMTILNVALPKLTKELSPTAAQQLWIIDIYSLVLAGLLIPISAIADRFGRKLILLLGFLAFDGASLGVLFADTPETVIIIRALLGVAGAMIMPTTLSMIRVIFTNPTERATALGIWAATSAVGLAIGPVVGGFLLEYFSWQSAFLVNVPLMAVALVAGIFLLPESKLTNPPRWDTAATIASISGMVSLVWSIKRFAKYGIADFSAWGALAAAVLILAWFIYRCLSRPDPMLDLRLFRRPPFTAGILAALASMFAVSALMLLLAQWLQLIDGKTPLAAGIAMLPAALTMVIASPLAPALAQRVGARTVLGAGLAIAALGFFLIYLAPAPLSYPWVAAALALVGGGAGALAVGSAIIMSDVPQNKAGNAAALEETSYELGSLLGVAILGSIASAVYKVRLDDAALTNLGLDTSQAETAEESLGATLVVAEQTGSTDLAAQASDAFVYSLAQTSLVGGIITLAAAIATVLLVPKGFDISKQNHH